MNKKIIIIIGVFLFLVGGYFWFQNKTKEHVITEEMADNLFSIDLIDSSLQEIDSPDLDFNISFDFGNFNLDIPNLSMDDVDVSSPDVNVGVSGVGNFDIGSSGGEGQITKKNCVGFKAAPSCSFVPSQYRDMCKQCKSAGF